MASTQGYGISSLFCEKEELITALLIGAGVKRNCSRVLLSLYSGSELNARDIERITGLRQPEVSVALHYLLEKEWVQVVDQYTGENQRSIKQYELIYSIDSILDSIMKEKKTDCDCQVAVVEEIRNRLQKRV